MFIDSLVVVVVDYSLLHCFSIKSLNYILQTILRALATDTFITKLIKKLPIKKLTIHKNRNQLINKTKVNEYLHFSSLERKLDSTARQRRAKTEQ